MDGEFYTDITRDTFTKRRHYSRVLMQQGRMQLDADWNEQVDILLHGMRRFASDIIGPHGGPNGRLGFGIDAYTVVPPVDWGKGKASSAKDRGTQKKERQPAAYQFTTSRGRYYVDGILVENDKEEIYTIPDKERQPLGKEGTPFIFYLDVWEREVTYLEDVRMRETALGGPDTATRSEVVWKLRAKNVLGYTEEDLQPEQYTSNNQRVFDLVRFGEAWTKELHEWEEAERGLLKARTMEVEDDNTDPCTIPPTSVYRGAENQLYRVEIHDGGNAWPDPAEADTGRQVKVGATFVWSRENGSVVFPIVGSVAGGQTITVTLENLGRDDSRFSLQEEDWVEIVDIEDMLERKPGPLFYVDRMDDSTMQVTLKSPSKEGVTFDMDSDPNKLMLLRRWDHKDIDPAEEGGIQLADSGAAKVIENRWFTLENGIQILFHRNEDAAQDQKEGDTPVPGTYHTGDYWLIPARTATGTIEWPGRNHEHDALPPHGVTHRYAPLAYVILDRDGKIVQNNSKQDLLFDLRRQFEGLAQSMPSPPTSSSSLADLADRYLGLEGGFALAEAGESCRQISRAVGSEITSTPLIATLFWQAFMNSPAFPRTLGRVSASSHTQKHGEKYVLVHGAGLFPRYDLIVFDPDFRQGDLRVIEQVEASPQDLSVGWGSFTRAHLTAIRTAFGGTILRYGEAAAVEAMTVERFGLIVAAPPLKTPLAEVKTESLSVFGPSPAWGVALTRDQNADRSVGIIARDRDGREGVTTALHKIQCLQAGTTKIFVNGVEGTLDPKDTNVVTDSCFIEIAGVASSPTASPLKGPLQGLTPRSNEQMTFERLSLKGPELVRTRVIGWSWDIPWAIEPWNQLKVITEPSSIPGDSGAALIDKDGYVIGFAFYVTTSGPGGYGYSAWIWAESVFKAHNIIDPEIWTGEGPEIRYTNA